MKIVLTPDWFLGENVFIHLFSFIVLFIFAFLSYKNYKLTKNKKILYLGAGFALIALAQLSTILTKLVLYYDSSVTRTIGVMMVTYHVVQSVDVFYHLGFFFYRILTIVGFYIIYKLPIEKKHRQDFFLPLFFIIVISILSWEMVYLFHLTVLAILILLIRNYYCVYEKNKSKNTLTLILAFIMLALSNVIFALSGSDSVYVGANIIELVSYIILLFLIIRIWKHGTKKKSDGYNIGHIEKYTRKKRED